MLRQLIVALGVVAVASQAGLAMAANPDTGPGCGLGKLAWADYKNQKNIAPQVMMATTNGTFGSGTFGISSGTSGCTNDGQVMADQKTTMFALLNFENLTQEMAQGKGEHLASLASLFTAFSSEPNSAQARMKSITRRIMIRMVFMVQ